MRKTTLVIGLVLLLVVTGVASAKYIPYVEDVKSDWGDFASPFQTPQAALFSGLYGRLGVYADVDVFAFEFGDPQKAFMVEALVPVCGDHFKAFAPSVALIGPGLDAPKADSLPFELPKDMGLAMIDKPVAKFDPDNKAYFGTTTQSYVAASFPIAEVGTYYIAVWEPNGHTGAYVLSTGSVHPDDISNEESARMSKEFALINSGEWMGQDCDAPITVENCPATPTDLVGDANISPAPVRRVVGEGYTLTGIVRDSTTCMPIADVSILVWVARANGRYDDDHRATLITNLQGAYRLDSERPGNYGPEPHIHMYVTAPGYEPLMTAYFLPEGEMWGEYSFNLVPEK
jgi:protocatechuate 3,4-dioxygenase beta subunit